MYILALEGNLRKAAGVCREWVAPSTTEEGSVAGEGGNPPFTPCSMSVGKVHTPNECLRNLNTQAALSASLPQGDETQKSINPTFTVVVTQPSSPVGHQLLYVIPAAGITRSLCLTVYVPGHRARD